MAQQKWTIFICSCAVAMFWCGCSTSQADRREREDRTRDEAERAAERVKPALEEAGRDIRRGAQEAAEQAHAAAQGVREGWNKASHSTIDINAASESDLIGLPGVDRPMARRIIERRPYRDKHDVVSRGVLSQGQYDKIRDQITAN
jgi:DNA uptake protein ComE-like DNA-binding protein